MYLQANRILVFVLLLGSISSLSGCISSKGSSVIAGSTAGPQGAGLEVYSKSPVDVPAGAAVKRINLNQMRWTVTGHIHRVAGPSRRDAAFTYSGNGHKDDNEVAKVVIPVTPGKAYVFSAVVDASHLISGKFDLVIDARDGKSSNAWFFHGKTAAQRFSTAAWLCPPDIHSVLLGMQLVKSAVSRGRKLTFSAPELSEYTVTSNARAH